MRLLAEHPLYTSTYIRVRLLKFIIYLIIYAAEQQKQSVFQVACFIVLYCCMYTFLLEERQGYGEAGRKRLLAFGVCYKSIRENDDAAAGERRGKKQAHHRTANEQGETWRQRSRKSGRLPWTLYPS